MAPLDENSPRCTDVDTTRRERNWNPGTRSPRLPAVNAERTDDHVGDAGAGGTAAPGQRAGARRAATSRRSASTSGLPTTPSAELPEVPAAAPTTALPTTAAHPIESPTTELRPASRTELRSPAGAPGPLPTNIYRSRRPGVAILLVIPAVAVGLLLVKALAVAVFGDTFDIAGAIASVSGLASLPFLVAGIYGLVTGAAHGAEHYGFRVWARPPLAYLIIGLSFVIVTGLAIR
jgi:hypothetical protein